MNMCPLCEKYPEDDWSKGGYKFFYCDCGAAESGLTTADAISRWNGVTKSRETKLLIEIAKKLDIVVIDQDSIERHKILTDR